MVTKRWLTFFAATLSILAVACGGDDGGGNDDDGGPSPPEGAPAEIVVTATDNVYDVQPAQGERGRIEAPANTEFSITLINDGALPHDIDFYDEEGGDLLSDDADGDILLEGEETTFAFTTPDPGIYYFQCSVHPTEMFGDFVVE